MRSGKCGKIQPSRIRSSVPDSHARAFLINGYNFREIGQVQLRIGPLGIEIHRDGHEVRVSGPLSISEQSPFHPLRTGQYRKLCGGRAASAVIVRMYGHDHIFTVLQMFADIFHLLRKHVRTGQLHRSRQIDDRMAGQYRFPHIQHPVADFQRIFRFCCGKVFGRILKPDGCVALSRVFEEHGRSFRRHPEYIALRFSEYLPALDRRYGIIQVHDRAGGASDRLVCPPYDMLPGLCQYLNRDIVRYQILLDQCPAEQVLRLGSSRKSDLDLLKPHPHQKVEIAELLVQVHGNNQRLISVTQIHAAPQRRRFDMVLPGPFEAGLGRKEIIDFIPLIIHHNIEHNSVSGPD